VGGKEAITGTRNPVLQEPTITQRCNKCLESKPATAEHFYKDKRVKTGLWRICKKCFISARAEKSAIYRNSAVGKRKKRNSRFLRTYGLTIEEYEALFEEQNGKCAICQLPPTEEFLAVDHNHENGRVRGLLCRKCNAAIGLLQEDYKILSAATTYILKNNILDFDVN
jgi:ribulose bisphosphate carboxylase small subunit